MRRSPVEEWYSRLKSWLEARAGIFFGALLGTFYLALLGIGIGVAVARSVGGGGGGDFDSSEASSVQYRSLPSSVHAYQDIDESDDVGVGAPLMPRVPSITGNVPRFPSISSNMPGPPIVSRKWRDWATGEYCVEVEYGGDRFDICYPADFGGLSCYTKARVGEPLPRARSGLLGLNCW